MPRLALTGRLLFVLLFGVYASVSLWTTRRAPATGDEVTYVMAADALLHGEGLEMTARWAVVDGADYSPGESIPREEFIRTTAPSRARDGNYPLHDLGLSLAILIPYAIGGRALVVVGIGAAMAVAIVLAVRTARRLSVPALDAWIG